MELRVGGGLGDRQQFWLRGTGVPRGLGVQGAVRWWRAGLMAGWGEGQGSGPIQAPLKQQTAVTLSEDGNVIHFNACFFVLLS